MIKKHLRADVKHHRVPQKVRLKPIHNNLLSVYGKTFVSLSEVLSQAIKIDIKYFTTIVLIGWLIWKKHQSR